MDRFGPEVWVRTGLAREESVKHIFGYNATLSFLFSCLEKAITRVVSSLILTFKSLMSLALFGCLLARPCLILWTSERVIFFCKMEKCPFS